MSLTGMPSRASAVVIVDLGDSGQPVGNQRREERIGEQEVAVEIRMDVLEQQRFADQPVRARCDEGAVDVHDAGALSFRGLARRSTLNSAGARNRSGSRSRAQA